MKTIPDLSTMQHVERYLDYQRSLIPHLTISDLVFFDSSKIEIFNPLSVKRQDILDLDAVLMLLQDLIDEGRFWVNIAGHSYVEKKFFVSIEYSNDKNIPATYINIAGPKPNQISLEESVIRIID